MGTPDASNLTLAAGAGHGEAGDAPQQGSAQEPIEALAAQPKPANKTTHKPANAKRQTHAETAVPDATGPVIELARASKPAAAQTGMRENGLVMTRPKPEKRKNAKERAKAKFAKGQDDKGEAKDGTRPMTATAKSAAETKAKTKAAAQATGKAERKAKRAAAKAA